MCKILQVGLSSMWTEKFQMYKLDLEKAEEPEIKLPTFTGSQKKQGNSRKTSASLIMLKPLTVWITKNCGKFLEVGITDHLTCLLRNLYAGQETTVRTGHGTTDWFQIEKGVHQSCHLAYLTYMWSSVQFSCSVVSDSLWPHGLQHARPPCPSPTPGVYPNSCPLSRWCHPTISFSVIHFSCPQSFPASGSFQMSQLLKSGGQSTGVLPSTSVLPMNTQDWSLGWTGWISLQAKGFSRVFSNTTVQKYQFFGTQLSL